MSDEFGVFWADKLYSGGDMKDAIVENFLYDRDVVCLIADPGVGKSILALQLMFNLTSGDSFLGVYDIKRTCNVLYVQTEGDRAETLERVKAMKMALSIDDTKWAHLNLPGLYLNTGEGLNKFLGYANQPKMKYDVIIIDPMYTTVKGSMLNDEVATDWVRNIRTIREVYGCAFIVLHHDNKESRTSDGEIMPRNKNSVFGSVFWGAFFNSTFKLSTKQGKHVLTGGKQRSGKIVDGIELEMVQPYPLYYKQVHESGYGDSIPKILSYIIASGPISAAKIIKATALSKGGVYAALKKLRNDKKVEKVGELYTNHILEEANEAKKETVL